MESISHNTKITIGLFITAASVIFACGYFFAKQDSMQDRLAVLESEKTRTVQIGQDVAVVKSQVQGISDTLKQAIARWDKHIDATSKN